MSKKVLIVEPSLAVRGIAESLLRQNGYEVIAAESVEAAKDILRDSRVDMLMVASELSDETGAPYFETLGADTATAMLPLLILHDPTGGELVYPPEAVISKPFTPRDFLDAVGVFGSKDSQSSTPFGDQDLEDALIDTALGLDKIEVDDAEVLDDDSAVEKKEGKKKVESMIGYDYDVKDEEGAKTEKKVVSINIPPDQTPEIPSPEAPPSAAVAAEESDALEKIVEPPIDRKNQLSESSKIEIVTDQYGISVPEEALEFHDNAAPGGTHDYDWFLKELQRESKPAEAGEAAAEKKPEPPAPKKPEETKSGSHTEAVDKFIDEFKKEMEKLTGGSSANIEVTNIAPDKSSGESKTKKSPGPGELNWEEGLEKITPAKIRGISKQLMEMMAAQIAERIVARLDDDVIYDIIRETVDSIIRHHAEEIMRKS